MTDFNPIVLLDRLSAFKPVVTAGRETCRTVFARDMHDRLMAKLDEMIGELPSEIAIWQELTAARETSREADFDYEIYCEPRCPFEARWIEDGPISLLDPIDVVIVAEGEAEARRVRVEYSEVPPLELEGLAGLMDEIVRQTGIRFVVARVPEAWVAL